MAERTKAAPAQPGAKKKKEEQAAPSPPAGKKWAAAAAAGGTAALLAAAGMLSFFLYPGGGSPDEALKQKDVLQIEDPDQVLAGAVYRFRPFVINIGAPDRHLTLAFAVEFFDFEPPSDLELRLPRIRDSIITIVSSKSEEQLVPLPGREKLRLELIRAVNAGLPEHNQIVDLYFTKFFLQ